MSSKIVQNKQEKRMHKSRIANLGYGFIFSPPSGIRDGEVNVSLLLAQWIAVAICTGIAYWLFRDTGDRSQQASSGGTPINKAVQTDSAGLLNSTPDDSQYEQALSEVTNGKQQAGLWARCLVETDGDKDKATARYIKQRVELLNHEGNGGPVALNPVASPAHPTSDVLATPKHQGPTTSAVQSPQQPKRDITTSVLQIGQAVLWIMALGSIAEALTRLPHGDKTSGFEIYIGLAAFYSVLLWLIRRGLRKRRTALSEDTDTLCPACRNVLLYKCEICPHCNCQLIPQGPVKRAPRQGQRGLRWLP